jgi:NADH dehydrogenase
VDREQFGSVDQTKPRVVIVGGGFGGLQVARALRGAPVDVVLIDRQNHHLFQPLLYQVATAALAPSDIAWPIRRLLRRQDNVRVSLAEVQDIDTRSRRVLFEGGEVPFDYLVLATGASHAWFGHDEWAPFAPGLKDLADAIHIRHRILEAFERAEMAARPDKGDTGPTVVVVGGGPTGVEMAGAVVELARWALARDFRRIDPASARVILVEAGDRLLSAFPEALSEYAAEALTELGVELRFGLPVTRCEAGLVWIGEESVRADTIVWAAGVQASPAAHWLDCEHDAAGRAVVNDRLGVPGLERVFVIGDTASCRDPHGRQLPGVSAVAKQQGAYVGRLIWADLAGNALPGPFVYRDAGQLATIGRNAAVADLGWIRFKGRLAWWFWGMVHIHFLIYARNRVLISIQWFWSWLTFDRGARLITDATQPSTFNVEEPKIQGQSQRTE